MLFNIHMNKNTYIALSIVIVFGIFLWVFLSSEKEKTPGTGPATVSTLSVSNVTSPALAVLAGTKVINWKTSNYPANAGVNISLIRKISDSPKEFTLVRTLATDTSNDGEELWIPQSGEDTDDLFIEVTCSSTYQFNSGCSLSSDPIKV